MASSTEMRMRDRFETYIKDLQNTIVAALEALDPSAPKFHRDTWARPQGGGGCSVVFPPPSHAFQLKDSVLEKAGVNISMVHGRLPPPAIKQMKANHSDIPYDEASQETLPFYAEGLSLVIHPRNPHAPTVHMNIRYFEISKSPPSPANSDAPTSSDSSRPAPPSDEVLSWWFGGGTDLTPSYLYEEDAVHFHRTLKNASDPYGTDLYPAFKSWCDEYFYIPHRQETRGIGGMFFDDLNAADHPRLANSTSPGGRPRSAEDILSFVKSLGDSFVPAYVPILTKRIEMPSSEEERRWQLVRRGRYVEFNLVYDRGTKFGLATPAARIESILMSLPDTARWEYMSEMGTLEDSAEARLLAVLKTPKVWL